MLEARTLALLSCRVKQATWSAALGLPEAAALAALSGCDTEGDGLQSAINLKSEIIKMVRMLVMGYPNRSASMGSRLAFDAG